MIKNLKKANKIKKPKQISIVKQPAPVVKIHPISLRELNKGHPWITEDSFTKEFPHKNDFLKAENGDEFIVLISDPNHPRIKARFWSRIDKHLTFHFALKERIFQACIKREQTINLNLRENYYLAFGEADFLPGLYIQYLAGNILIQSHLEFWNRQKKNMVKHLEEFFQSNKNVTDKKIQFFWQNRYGINRKIMPIKRRELHPFYLREFNVIYKIDFSLGDDIGLYTDMSAIRKEMEPMIKGKTSLLNLYSYTGAFSLFAMSLGVEDVHSVDLSEKYLAMLENNISKNPSLNIENHHSHQTDVKKALKKFNNTKQFFDTIVCDPPSFSRGKNSFQKSLNDYQTLIPLMEKSLSNDGHLICFINTHKINWPKFKSKFSKILEDNSHLTMKKYLKMSEDCLKLSGFPEGDYIKGIILQKTRS